MKAKWSKFEILVTCLSVAIIPMAAWLTAAAIPLMFGPDTALLSFVALFFVTLICTAVLVCFLKKRNKRIWPGTIVLTVLLSSLGLAAKNLSKSARLIKLITGHYNIEAVGFDILFLILLCSGALVGIGAGSLIASKRNTLKFKTNS